MLVRIKRDILHRGVSLPRSLLRSLDDEDIPLATGLYHFAILVPGRRELAVALKRLREHGWPLEGAADHGVSEALYLRDPDDNGVEIYRDRPKSEWPQGPDGELVMYSHPFDLDALLAELR